MSPEPNFTVIEAATPTLFEREEALDEPPRGGWRIGLMILIAVALPMEIAWLVKRSDPWQAERREVAALSEADRAELAAKWDRYQKLTPDEQRRLQALHQAIENDDDPESLRTALADYEKFKSTLSPPQSAALVGLSPPERIAKLRGLAAEQSTVASKALSPADAKTLIAWLEAQVDRNQDRLLAGLPQPAKQRFESLGRREKNVALILAALAYRGAGGPKLEHISLEALVELRAKISPDAQRVWDAASSIEEKKLLLADWIRQAAARAYGAREGMPLAARIGEVELQQFFEKELSESERARFMALPREEMGAQLKREYLRRKGLWKEPPGNEPPNGFRPPNKQPAGPRPPGVLNDVRPPQSGEKSGGDRRPFGTGGEPRRPDAKPPAGKPNENGPSSKPRSDDGPVKKPPVDKKSST